LKIVLTAFQEGKFCELRLSGLSEVRNI
jgi:hypothetical protein